MEVPVFHPLKVVTFSRGFGDSPESYVGVDQKVLYMGPSGKATVKMIFPTWVWLKINQGGLRRFWSMFPLTRSPFWYQFFVPQPHGTIVPWSFGGREKH